MALERIAGLSVCVLATAVGVQATAQPGGGTDDSNTQATDAAGEEAAAGTEQDAEPPSVKLDDLVLARQIENPVSGITRVPLNNTVLFGLGPNDQVGNVLVVAPIVPALFRNDWSLITRVILPVAVTVPDIAAGSGTITGFGDMSTDILGHKALEGRRGQLYDVGAGPVIGFPTASNDALGSKRWRLGPEIVMGITARRIVTVLLARNVWSVGDSTRPDVNQLFLEYLLFYNLPKLWYLATEPLITANWKASRPDRWFVPLGGGVGKHFRVRRLPRLSLTTRLQAF